MFTKIRRVGNELSHIDGQTDMTKLIVDLAVLRTRLRMLRLHTLQFTSEKWSKKTCANVH
jgi:hypothetical protein